ncbi:hypothetical protein XW81_00365 [Buchnera aphidicola (Schlechtendalia chinensis)]|uniref:Flagellar hook-length control protein-like C-terminal domain-containing protein n=1 Tax=Buchnera aphidicola subsp. Schlechtendalia chinensis TaxID=118110 RepID=A0A172WD48_BUCSC|nr:flagellar hook-length control protein FliK [Buchnera aphidicola]ANF16888.1 hypothetical protein XW81_00365 [Buchnera aphidicola (Schlechtendalia chinensis)]
MKIKKKPLILPRSYDFIKNNIFYIKHVEKFLKSEKLSKILIIDNYIKKYCLAFLNDSKIKNNCIILDMFRRNFKFFRSLNPFLKHNIKNVSPKFFNLINFNSNFFKLKDKILQLFLNIKSGIVLNNSLKNKIHYKECINSIINFLHPTYAFIDIFGINNKIFFKKLSSFLFHNNSSNLIHGNWMKAVQNQLLTFFLNSKKNVEFFLSPQYLGRLFIRLKLKRKKSIQLNVMSDNKIVRKALRSNVNNFRNTIFKVGIKLENITITNNKNVREASVLENSQNFRNNVIDNVFHIINKNVCKNFYGSCFSELHFFPEHKSVINFYI